MSRLLSATNTGWGTLAFTLNRPMCRSITLAVNILRSSGDVGEHVALGAHESDWRHILGQQVYCARHPCCSHGRIIHLGTVPRTLLGGLCTQMQPGVRENIQIVLGVLTSCKCIQRGRIRVDGNSFDSP
jgi:hypothetical protein